MAHPIHSELCPSCIAITTNCFQRPPLAEVLTSLQQLQKHFHVLEEKKLNLQTYLRQHQKVCDHDYAMPSEMKVWQECKICKHIEYTG